MPEDILILVAHGIGDHLLGIQCAKSVLDVNPQKTIRIISCSRDEVFKPLKYCFPEIEQHPLKEKWGENNWILNNLEELESIKYQYPEIYYIVPDLLMRGPLSFAYKKYNLDPSIIASKRLLLHKRENIKNSIYVGLGTTTGGYDYKQIRKLIVLLAKRMSSYQIIVPIITKWANQSTNLFKELGDNVPGNVVIKENPCFISSLEDLFSSCYGIYTDNGPSHIAYHVGQPRCILDPRMPEFQNDCRHLPWCARWRENCYNDSVPINSTPENIAELVAINITLPQTNLLPKNLVINNLTVDWPVKLYFKY